ncbi:MAG: hormogonium polysaccharide biosynthesis glycosyltransferase HpsO [Nostocaceae cyanobacterium]|nr:hormogonium polysaccharide biosynthesis glycosyltransferase HpsO [Nostocaceae cyanobacterium]
MKVLVASHTYIVDLNCEKLRALSELEPNLEVTVIVPKRWRPRGVQNKIIETQYCDEGNFRIIPVSNFSQNHQGLLTFGTDLISLLQEFHPQIIQVEQGSRSFAYAEMITLNRVLGLNAKNIFFTWWNLPYKLKFPINLLEKYNLNNSHGIICGNQDGAEILRQRGYKGSIKVLPQLGVDESLFQPQAQPELASQLGIKDEDFVVGFVGRFVKEKGIITLLNSLSLILDKPWRLLLLGRGELQSELMRISVNKKLQNRIIWLESVPHNQVYQYINLMNTLVLPSETNYNLKNLTSVGWKEQFGHVLIEAMACQVPVIGSNSGEIPHVIGDAGLIFQEGEEQSLANCLLQLMNNSELAEKIGYMGYQRVMSKYTNKALAKEQLEFYQKIINS